MKVIERCVVHSCSSTGGAGGLGVGYCTFTTQIAELVFVRYFFLAETDLAIAHTLRRMFRVPYSDALNSARQISLEGPVNEPARITFKVYRTERFKTSFLPFTHLN